MQGPGGGGRAAPGGAAAAAVTVTVLSLIISKTVGGSTITLPTTTLQRPCYLVDLRNVADPPSGALDLNGGGRKVTWDGFGESMTYENSHNGPFTTAPGSAELTSTTWPAIATFTAGTVQEFVVTGANAHPLHIHVNPFQITDMPADSYNGDYFQVGDWHDTLMISDMGGNSELTVRSQLDVFTGKTVVHCHILEHEDEGMMSWFQVDGTEGATYAPAKTIDRTCYDTASAIINQNPGATDGSAQGQSAEPTTEPSTGPTGGGTGFASGSASGYSAEPTTVPSTTPSATHQGMCASIRQTFENTQCCNPTDFVQNIQCASIKQDFKNSGCSQFCAAMHSERRKQKKRDVRWTYPPE